MTATNQTRLAKGDKNANSGSLDQTAHSLKRDVASRRLRLHFEQSGAKSLTITLNQSPADWQPLGGVYNV